MSEVYFVSGIDTDAGKTYVTGYLAKQLMNEGKSVATLKFIQTGCENFSEDIEKHREIMGVTLPEDEDGTTAPLIYSYPASAQLAAKIDGREIELDKVDKAVTRLLKNYDVVLIEGAGGLMVPITDDYFTIDYVAEREIPVILVTNGVLGSINHTVLSLEALKNRNIGVDAVVYNHYFDKDKLISEDTRGFIGRYVAKEFPEAKIIDVPAM